ncbi:accessory factor associated with RNA polymerase II [Geranomyces variabilis]|nr:accessory factor associated with RNA polymerase II [Geranomyces variabilis]
MSSAITLLHKCHASKTPYVLVPPPGESTSITDPRLAAAVRFGDVQIDISAPSGFKDYDVKCLLHFYQSRDIPFTDYVKASADDAQSLNFMDRKEVLALLESDPDAPRKDAGGLNSAKRVLDGGAGGSDAKRPRLVLDPNDVAFAKEVKARERIISNDYGTTSLRVSTKQTFTSLIELAKKCMAEKHRKGPAQSGSSRAHVDARRPNPAQASRSQPPAKPSSRSKAAPESRIPIIIVPSVPTARLTLWNVKQFLAGTTYIPTQKFIDDGTPKSVSVRFERQLRAGHQGVPKFPTTYQVVDSPDNIKPEDWPRVVAAFVTGQSWQFGRWKYKDPSQLFTKIKGFCLKYGDEPAPGDVDKWAVTKLDISRGIRHNDYNAVNKFWDHVDAFILRDKRKVFFD